MVPSGADALQGTMHPDRLFATWVSFVVAQRTELAAALDWTDFDSDDHTTLSLSVVTTHGRSTHLLWKTVPKSQLKKRKNVVEDDLLRKLRELVPESVRITIIADRGFGDQKLYASLRELKMDFIIRFRSNITVTDKGGTSQPAQHPDRLDRQVR